MRILIIDDDVTSNKIIAENLKKQGYTCDVVDCLKETSPI